MKEFISEEKCEILDQIYSIRQEKLGRCTETIKNNLNNISQEEIENFIDKIIENKEIKRKIINKLENLIENYEIKMEKYVEDAYKQGFKDALNLYIECCKN